MIRFVIPAYDEVENVPRLMADLAPRVHELGAAVIFVDDGSTDGTAEAIKVARAGTRPTVVRHERNRGLGRALESGLRAALEESSNGDAIVTLEADTTSNLDDLPRMLELLDAGHDVVVASVWAPGGRAVGVDPSRAVASRVASSAFRLIGGLRNVHTLSSLYRAYRAGALRRAAEAYGRQLVREPGFAASVELLFKLHNAGARVAEVPTVNDWTRRRGRSKMSPGPTAAAYLRLAAAQLSGRLQPPAGG
jgi:dolichol-phosphate mannosyltransferase